MQLVSTRIAGVWHSLTALLVCGRARAQAQQKVISSDQIIYNSDRGLGEVDDGGADFDRRLKGEQDSAQQLADARLLWDQKQQEKQQQQRGSGW